MTFKQLWTTLKTVWHSRPFAIIMPILALAWYWFKHGHSFVLATSADGGSFPTLNEWGAGSLLLFTKFGHVMELFVGPPAPETLPTPVVAPLLKSSTDGGKGGAVALLLGLSLLGGGVIAACATTPPIVDTAVTVAKDCADQATHVAAINIIGDVATALASDSWTSALTDLVTRWGIAAVDCAVQEVAGEANHNAQASGDKLSSLKATRGRQWLTAHPIGVDGGSP